jgi:hypothetical protein
VDARRRQQQPDGQQEETTPIADGGWRMADSTRGVPPQFRHPRLESAAGIISPRHSHAFHIRTLSLTESIEDRETRSVNPGIGANPQSEIRNRLKSAP